MKRKAEVVAKGHCAPGGWKKVIIQVDEDTFDEVREGAIENGVSWAAQSRMLIEVGLEALKEPQL